MTCAGGRASSPTPTMHGSNKEFMEAGKERLTRDAVRDATQQEVQALRRGNVELKQLVAELSLEGYRLKKTAIPMPHDATGTNG